MTQAGLPRVVAIANGKGGVYKTSITAAIGGLAAAGGMRALVVDLDPQGNLTEDLGAADETDEGESTFLALRAGSPLHPRASIRERLDVVYGGSSLRDVEQMLPNRNGGTGAWQHALANSLAPVVDDYDLIVLDCPPRSPNLTTMALVAARYVVIPTQPDRSSRKGMRELAELFGDVRPMNPDLDLLGVVLTNVDAKATRIHREARQIIGETLGDIAPVFDAVIHYGSGTGYQVREKGRLPHELSAQLEIQERTGPWEMLRRRRAGEAVDGGEVRLPKSAGTVARDYTALTREVLGAIAAREQEVTS